MDSGSSFSQNQAFFQDPYPTHVCASGVIKDSIGTSTSRNFGVGICRPVARVLPIHKMANSYDLDDWMRIEDPKQWEKLRSLAEKKLHEHIEHI